jgi:hypothetical protein
LVLGIFYFFHYKVILRFALWLDRMIFKVFFGWNYVSGLCHSLILFHFLIFICGSSFDFHLFH